MVISTQLVIKLVVSAICVIIFVISRIGLSRHRKGLSSPFEEKLQDALNTLKTNTKNTEEFEKSDIVTEEYNKEN